ncbi:MAG: sigma 54-interacting transcriptional regulator, partial [Deltaproteobacteria bacterium]|nr:sigma 54-interacting transcriptional regulator [Deltaproteobacteria bacterium]
RRGAVEAQATALAEAERAGDRHGAATCAANLGSAALEAGRVVEAVQRLRGAALDMTALGAARELPAVLINLAHALVRAGDAEGGERVLDHAAAAAPPEVWAGVAGGYAAALRADAARQRGDLARAAAFLAEALARPETAADRYAADEMRCDLADLRAQLGDVAAARALLAEVSAPAGRPAVEAKRRATELRVALAAGEEPGDGAMEAAVRALQAMPEPRDRPVEWRAWTVVACAAKRAGRKAAARAAAVRAEDTARAWREEVREMGFDPLGSDPDRRSLEDLIAEGGTAGPVAAEEPAGPVSDRELRRWLAIQRRLASERHPARLLDTILDTLIELVGAERGMLLTRRRGTGELVVRRARNLASGALGGADGGTISLSIAEEVARTGEPLLTMDARQDGRFLASRSVHDLGLRSVMVLPLLARGRTVGVAYLDHRLRESAFSAASVEAALDFAGQAALALETARHLRLLRRRRQEIERLNAELRQRVEAQAMELRGLKETLDSALPPEVADPFPGFVGRSPPIRDLFRRMKRVAETDLPVLILGESGTGKELVARALYARGRRREAPFVTENCAAIPESLLESILFGHVRGAFTGADRDHAGLFVVADKGTLFLDEIGEMSLGLQSKLLRELEDGEVRAVGGTSVRRVDVRILAASNRDLEAMVREGRFREDLFYRLAVLTLRLPALRERVEDVPLLVAHFTAKHAAGRKVRVAPGAMRRLAEHPWPGNVRQLENTVVRALVLAGSDTLDEGCVDFGTSARGAPSSARACPESLDLKAEVEVLERTLIERALEQAQGNRTRAARLLGLSRFGLLKKLQRGTRATPGGAGTRSRG